MAQLGPNPLFRAYATDATLLRGGTVDTYATGASTTRKPTYSDWELKIKNPNPIVLDSLGEAKVYLMTDAEYRFVIKDSDGNTRHTIDNISPVTTPTILYDNMDINGKSIVSASNGDIAITPDGAGYLILDGLKFPRGDSTNTFVIGTDGSGTLSFIANGTFWLPDTTPQLGAALDANNNNIKFDNGTGFRDDSDNEQLIFRTTPLAVNQIDITNSATNNAVAIAATGDDTDIPLNINSKGPAGRVVIDGISYPKSDGTNGQSLITDGSGTLSFGAPTANSASAADVLSATGDKAISAGLLKHHLGVPKVWIRRKLGQSDVSYGVTNVTQSGTHLRINFSTAMSSANYAVSSNRSNSTNDNHLIVNDQTTTYVDIKNRNTTTGTSFTPSTFVISVFGEQA